MKRMVALVLSLALVLALVPAAFAEADAPKYDLKGNTVKLRMWDKPNPYAEDCSEVDKAEWLPRYEAIKKAYNCEIELYTSTSEWNDMPAEWIMSVSGGQPAWHVTNNMSSMWLMQLVASDALADIGKGVATLDIPQLLKDVGMVGEGYYGFTDNIPGPEGLVFNRGMIEEAGMEYDPGEMYKMGKWDYESFLAYMTELQQKLPEGTYSFFIDPNYWGIFAPPANGGEMAVHTDFSLGLTSDEFIETFELLEKMIAAGLVRPANTTDDGYSDYWGTPAATFDQGVEVAMTHRAMWQVGTLNANKLDWGFVPYPYGMGAKVMGEDYTTVEGTHGSYYDLGLMGAVLKGAEKDFPGLDSDYVTEALVNLIFDLSFTEEDKEAFSAMAAPDYMPDPPDFFADELSAELYNWLKMHTKYNPIATINAAGLGKSYGGEVSLYGLMRKPFNDGTAVRSTFEAAVPEIEASFRDAGYLK